MYDYQHDQMIIDIHYKMFSDQDIIRFWFETRLI